MYMYTNIHIYILYICMHNLSLTVQPPIHAVFPWVLGTQRMGKIMGCEVSGIMRMPCIIRKWWTLRSKFVHKRHMDVFEERTYVRFVEVRKW